MIEFSKRYADAVARLRVTAGFVLVAAFAWFSRPTAVSLAIGLPVSILGLALRGWAAGSLYKDRNLAIAGPYAFTRNPLYLGTLIVAAGLAVASRSMGLGILFAAVFLLVYLPAIQLEQQHLRDIFPDYAAYAKRVPMLLPRLTAAGGASNPFTWAQYRKNREYQAAIGFGIGVAWLVVRAMVGRS